MLIVDYGASNLRNVQKAFEAVGVQATISSSPDEVAAADKLILPGVGAFGEAMVRLREQSLDKALHEAVNIGTPLLGICLGLQLLFEQSEEWGGHEGLGFFRGVVRRLDIGLKVPHIGWNEVRVKREHPLLAELPATPYGYFNHSYYVDPSDDDLVLATTDYDIDFACICGRDNVMGIQFHPEKSQEVGLKLLRNFATGFAA